MVVWLSSDINQYRTRFNTPIVRYIVNTCLLSWWYNSRSQPCDWSIPEPSTSGLQESTRVSRSTAGTRGWRTREGSSCAGRVPATSRSLWEHRKGCLQWIFWSGECRDHFEAWYGDILPSFCQISHTFDQREILLSHNILKYLH